MKIVEISDFLEWIKTKPDDHQFRMFQTEGKSSCGCLMVQYAREVLKLPDDLIACGYMFFDRTQTIRLEEEISSVFPPTYWHTISTFGELKKILFPEI